MIPEGVLAPVSGGFRLYLQSNFANRPGVERRRRFTLAHELVHTFFYELVDGVPRPRKSSPKGEKLERLCHLGASQILVPDGLLAEELSRRGEVASSEAVLELAKAFDVSVEVVMRRLHERRLFSDEKFAAILVDTIEGGKRVIRGACYGSLLLCNVTRPVLGMDFDRWMLPLFGHADEYGRSEWTRTTPTATITARKVRRSRRSFILDLRFDKPSVQLA